MTILAVAALAAALAAAPQAGAQTPPPPAPSAAQAMGGPFEPVPLDPEPIIVEGRRGEPVSIATDPRLERRYAPRERAPLGRVIVRF